MKIRPISHAQLGLLACTPASWPYTGVGFTGSAPDTLTACFSCSLPLDAGRFALPVDIPIALVTPGVASSICVRAAPNEKHNISRRQLNSLHGMHALQRTAHLGNLEQAHRNQAFLTASHQRVHLRSFRSSTVMLMLCARQPVLNSHRVQPHVMGLLCFAKLLQRTSLVVVVICNTCVPSSSLVTHARRCCLHVCLVVMSFCSVARGVQRGCSQTVVSASFVTVFVFPSIWSMVPQKRPTVPQNI